MIKKIVALTLALIMVFSLVSCTKSKGAGVDEVISPVSEADKAELTILLNAIEYDTLTKTKYFGDYIEKFKKDFGVNIKFEKVDVNPVGIIEPEEISEYMQKLTPKLIVKEGPELIFAQYMSMEALIEQQAVLDLRGKVANIDKVYEPLLRDKACYLPLGIAYYSYSGKISKDALEELKADAPALDWTSKEYYALRNKWISKNKIYFNGDEYFRVVRQFLDIESLYKASDNKIILNTPEVRKNIHEIRNYIFNGTYQLIDDYKYENYFNMMFEDTSQENKVSFQLYRKNLENGYFDGGLIANLFRAEDIHDKNEKYGTIMYPQFQDKEILMDSYGFLVNKNGKNLDLAYEFLNGLLSNEVQMSMFEHELDYYPVNKEIEADIIELEGEKKLDPKVIELKAFALQQLKDGKCQLWITTDNQIHKIRSMVDKDLAKLILADNAYSDEQLQFELKKLEDKYNILLNE